MALAYLMSFVERTVDTAVINSLFESLFPLFIRKVIFVSMCHSELLEIRMKRGGDS